MNAALLIQPGPADTWRLTSLGKIRPAGFEALPALPTSPVPGPQP